MKVHLFWPDCFIVFLGKEKSFHNHVWPCFRYDGDEDGLVPLYLITQKAPEDENFRVDRISYGLQSMIVGIEKMFIRNPRVF
jgi:hypothetical protein